MSYSQMIAWLIALTNNWIDFVQIVWQKIINCKSCWSDDTLISRRNPIRSKSEEEWRKNRARQPLMRLIKFNFIRGRYQICLNFWSSVSIELAERIQQSSRLKQWALPIASKNKQSKTKKTKRNFFFVRRKLGRFQRKSIGQRHRPFSFGKKKRERKKKLG